MAHSPKVSVILTSFNHAKYLREAIDSVLNQTFDDFELIIWDDASVDESWEIIQSYSDPRIKTFRNEEQMRGIYGINKAISEVATGDYVAIHHSDDVWEIEKIEKQVAVLNSNPDVSAVFTWVKIIDEHGGERDFEWFNRKYDRWRLLREFFYGENHLNHPSILIRRSIYQEIGMYKYGLAQTGDAELWSRLLLKYEIDILEEALVLHRLFLDGSNTSGPKNNSAVRVQNEWNILRKNFLECSSKRVFFNIFPEALQLDGVQPFSITRALAFVALNRNLPHSAWGFGIDLLYQHISNDKGDGRLTADYDYRDLIKDSGTFDVFGTSLSQVVAERNQVVTEHEELIASLKGTLELQERQFDSLKGTLELQERQLKEIYESNAWKLTMPLRMIGGLRLRLRRYIFTNLRSLSGKYSKLSKIVSVIPKAISFYQGSFPLTVRRVVGVYQREGLGGLVRRARILTGHPQSTGDFSSDFLYGDIQPLASDFRPLVSVIVPNFNHAIFLKQRLDSLYQQTYQNFEVILLDDCSTDDSVEILREYAERYAAKTISSFNAVNSGGVFNQWKKGLELATGELIWIAESDDYCSENFLEELVRSFQNQAVMLAFSRTEFVRGMPPMKVWTSKEYLSDLGLDIWDRSFIKSAHSLVKSGWVVKNIVPNVSSAVFRHPGKLSLLDDAQWLKLRMCGDWVFYLSIVRGGLVAYIQDATNYYRQHPLNTSVNAQREEVYYKEHAIVAKYLAKLYLLDRTDFERQERHLYLHWCSRRGESRREEFRTLYDLDQIWQHTMNRKPNITMAIYALAAGGGETFPIVLANLLHEEGYAVTVLNCKEQIAEPGVRRMLSRSIPLLELDSIERAGIVFTDMGVELVHSHHAWVDVTLAMLLINRQDIRQIVTMHGMYEMMTPGQLAALLPLLKGQINRFVYTAEKNLVPFSSEFRREKGFCKIHNALQQTEITPIPRIELQIGNDDFVVCLVARAIPDKGWAEAIDAVAWANARSSRKIYLLLIGEGPEFDRLKSITSHEFVKFLGFRSNIRDYFVTSDIGFLPSRFKGESFPLVLIDCLLSGKPMLASNIGEIRYMLDSDEGLAGELFDLDEWKIDVAAVGQIILTLANDDVVYQRLSRRVPLAAAKFEASVMVHKYEKIYYEALVNDDSEQVYRTMKSVESQC